jgi:hypothetical protein
MDLENLTRIIGKGIKATSDPDIMKLRNKLQVLLKKE